MAQRTIKIGSLAPGVNNRLEPTQLDTVLPDRSKGTYLYSAENVDINENGYLKRRQGQTVVDATAAHSLWSDATGSFAVLGENLTALAFSGNGQAVMPTVIRAGMPKNPVSYSRGGDGDVYWTNGSSLRRIASGNDRPVMAEPPGLLPTVSSTSGALPAGIYLVAFTVVNADGESAATPVQAIELPANSGITFVSSETVNVFMSAPDGDILTYQTTGTTGTLISHNEMGRICRTLNRAVMPPGQIVRHYNGRMVVAAGAMLYISDPYNYGLYNPSKGFIGFGARIDMMEPTDNGLYIAADKTYWLTDLVGGTPQEVLPYGAVPYSSGRRPDEEQVYWNSPNGLIVADKNMSVKAVQDDQLRFGSASYGASLYRHQDGMAHVVASRAGAGLPTAAASSYFEARVISKGTVL